MERRRERNLSLWIGILLPPAAWSIAMEAIYLTNDYSCYGAGVAGWSHLSAALGVVLCIIGGVIAWTQLPERAGNDSASLTRDRFMANLGIVLSLIFALLIVAQWLPMLVGIPCGK
jgi:hypothetical protein